MWGIHTHVSWCWSLTLCHVVHWYILSWCPYKFTFCHVVSHAFFNVVPIHFVMWLSLWLCTYIPLLSVHWYMLPWCTNCYVVPRTFCHWDAPILPCGVNILPCCPIHFASGYIHFTMWCPFFVMWCTNISLSFGARTFCHAMHPLPCAAPYILPSGAHIGPCEAPIIKGPYGAPYIFYVVHPYILPCGAYIHTYIHTRMFYMPPFHQDHSGLWWNRETNKRWDKMQVKIKQQNNHFWNRCDIISFLKIWSGAPILSCGAPIVMSCGETIA